MVRSLADRTFQLRLPARVLLGTVDRSEPNVMRLATGLEITEARRPRGRLADPVWANYKKAQDAYAAVSPGDRPLLEAVLLAGGGDPEGLPPPLAAAVAPFEDLPDDRMRKLNSVRTALTDIAIEASKQASFKDKLGEIFDLLARQLP